MNEDKLIRVFALMGIVFTTAAAFMSRAFFMRFRKKELKEKLVRISSPL